MYHEVRACWFGVNSNALFPNLDDRVPCFPRAGMYPKRKGKFLSGIYFGRAVLFLLLDRLPTTNAVVLTFSILLGVFRTWA